VPARLGAKVGFHKDRNGRRSWILRAVAIYFGGWVSRNIRKHGVAPPRGMHGVGESENFGKFSKSGS